MAPEICCVANICATTSAELWGSGLRVSPTEKPVARYTKAASTMWHTMAVCPPYLPQRVEMTKCKRVQIKCRQSVELSTPHFALKINQLNSKSAECRQFYIL